MTPVRRRISTPIAWMLAALAPLLLALPVLADGPGVLKFDETSFEVAEEAGVAVITVERSNGEDGAVSVQYATADGSAVAGSDYTAASGTLSWEDGDGSNRTFMVPILDDSADEGAETVQLALSNPTGGATLDPDRGTSTLVILASDGGGGGDDGGGDDGGGDDGGGDDNGGDDNGDDDGDGAVGIFKFDQRNFYAVESIGVAVISVERSQGESGAASVDYAATAGTATAGADFTEVSGTLSWGAGDESRRTFTVPLVNDGIEEGAETVLLALTNPTGGAGLSTDRATALLTIVDNDAGLGTGDDDGSPGVLKFDETSFEVIEGSAQAVIRVERSRGETGAVSVGYAATDGSATDGLDYSAVSGVLSWASGDGSVKTFNVPLLDDALLEGNETVALSLSNPTGGAGIDAARGTSTLVILDDDGATTPCVDDDSTLCLLNDRFEVEVEWRTSNGNVGSGTMVPQSDRSGLVWFFSDTNIELLVKMLDACDLPAFESYWVFFAATTNVDFTVTVTDTGSGVVKQYTNPLGNAAAPVQDTLTFKTCP